MTWAVEWAIDRTPWQRVDDYRARVRSVPCPVTSCRAMVGERCRGRYGQFVTSHHVDRCDAYLRAKREAMRRQLVLHWELERKAG